MSARYALLEKKIVLYENFFNVYRVCVYYFYNNFYTLMLLLDVFMHLWVK